MLFGGLLAGYITGLIFANWIHVILKDNKLLVMITMFCTYGLFFFCETFLEVSGILAVVTFGLYLGSLGSVHLTHESDEAVRTVWNFVSFVLETLIFFITGTYMGYQIEHGFERNLTYLDLFKVVLFYPLTILVKFLVLLIFSPLLNCVGYKIKPLTLFMMSYGSLKGAVALAIALLVSLDDKLDDYFRDILLLYVVGMIAMTVCLSGLSMEFIMKKTGFLQEFPIKMKMKMNLTMQLLINLLHKETELREDNRFKRCGVNWEDVYKLSHIGLFKEIEKKLKKRQAEKAKRKASGSQELNKKKAAAALDNQLILPKINEEIHNSPNIAIIPLKILRPRSPRHPADNISNMSPNPEEESPLRIPRGFGKPSTTLNPENGQI